MAFVLEDVPFYDHETTVDVGTEKVIVRPFQIVVWVSITQRYVDKDTFDPSTPSLPALLDTGLSYYFAIREEHLTSWAKTPPATYPRQQDIVLNRARVPAHRAAVWIHRNKPGTRDELLGDVPHPLRARSVAVYEPGKATFVRFPLLGLRAFELSRLRLSIDFEQCSVSLWEEPPPDVPDLEELTDPT